MNRRLGILVGICAIDRLQFDGTEKSYRNGSSASFARKRVSIVLLGLTV